MPKESPTSPSTGPDCKEPATKKTTSKCPLEEFELVELVEVVTRDKEKWVEGPAMETADTKVVDGKVERKDKDGSNYKQYINLDKDAEGSAKRHPEYGREIEFRARIRQKNGNTDKLAGKKVNFSFKRTDGPNRTNPGGSDPDVWSGTDLTGSQKEGFGSANGTAETSSTTDQHGWTAPISLYLSMFGGDQYEVGCALDQSVPGAKDSKALKTTAKYVVWRKFWYQMTYADGYNAPQPTESETAYGEVFAEMVKANTKKFKKEDFPSDLQDRTFMKEYMLKQGGANKIIANVGAKSNIDEFKTNAKLKKTTEAEHPVKENVIVCEYQCDPKGTSQLKTYKLTSDGQSITIASGTGGRIVSKPAIEKGKDLVAFGEWATTKTPWTKGGDITDANIEIDSARSSTRAVKINLPSGAPTPTTANPVYVKLQVETAKSFLGWAPSAGIVCVYRPSASSGAKGSKEDYNDTVAHEFGHKWKQTPKPSKQPDSMKNHPLQYVGHGGTGPHCRHGATVAPGPVNWQDASQKTPSPQNGDCIMFHKYSASSSHKFCKTCKPYLQLQDMSSL